MSLFLKTALNMRSKELVLFPSGRHHLYRVPNTKTQGETMGRAMFWNAKVSKTSAQHESCKMKEVLAVGILLHLKGGVERKSLDQ